VICETMVNFIHIYRVKTTLLKSKI